MNMTSLPCPNDTEAKPFGSSLLVLRLGKRSSILLVALNNPRKKNSFSDAQYEDLIRILGSAEKEDSIDAIVLTGYGNYFTSGADIKSFFGLADYLEEDETVGAILKTPAALFMTAMIDFQKVLVAAVNGPAVGIGVTLLPHCDLVYCTDNSTFWTPFSRIAIVPEFSSSQTFVEAMGVARANNLLLMGKKIDADQAFADKLVTEIVRACDQSGNPFAVRSIGYQVSNDLDNQLLSLTHGDKTAKVRS
jgi:peroxisomal 3,2-trans-enoyl-CoA isomerase